MFKTIHEKSKASFIVNKSEFIGYACPCDTEEDALEFISYINEKHKDATHNCYAYIIGKEKLIQRFSDDGEPSGTAGVPMLEVLKKEDLTNLCVVVTRYFGGIKLGAGGLVRAYSKSVRVALEANKIVEKKIFDIVELDLDYSLLGVIENYLAVNNLIAIDKQFLDRVFISVYIQKDKFNQFKGEMDNLSSATIKISRKKEVYLSTINDEIIL